MDQWLLRTVVSIKWSVEECSGGVQGHQLSSAGGLDSPGSILEC